MRTEYLVICSSPRRAYQLMEELSKVLYDNRGFRIRAVFAGPRQFIDILDNDTLIRFVGADHVESLTGFVGTVLPEPAIVKFLEEQKK